MIERSIGFPLLDSSGTTDPKDTKNLHRSTENVSGVEIQSSPWTPLPRSFRSLRSGFNRQFCTAVMAASANMGGPCTTFSIATVPSVFRRTSRTTSPCTPAFLASAGYSGLGTLASRFEKSFGIFHELRQEKPLQKRFRALSNQSTSLATTREVYLERTECRLIFT